MIYLLVWERKMATRNKNKKKGSNFKKNPAQVHAYSSFIANSSYSPDATMPDANKMLLGTAEIHGQQEAEIEQNDPIRKKSVKYRIGDWIKEHIFPTIITTIIIAIGTVLISHTIQLAVMEQKIEYLDEQIDALSSEAVDKDELELQLESLKKELENSSALALNDIKWQIKILEDKINSMQTSGDE